MNLSRLIALIALVVSFLAPYSFSKEVKARFTAGECGGSSLEHVLAEIQKTQGVSFSPKDFQLAEDRDLATSHFQTFLQLANGIPISRKSIRIWSSEVVDEKRGTKEPILIQAEANLEGPLDVANMLKTRVRKGLVSNIKVKASVASSQSLALRSIRSSSDHEVRSISSNDEWQGSHLVRVVKIKAKRGVHFVVVSLDQNKVLSTSYEEYPQYGATFKNKSSEQSLPAMAYLIYEQPENSQTQMSRLPVELKYIRRYIPRVKVSPYDGMANENFFETNFDPYLGETPEGRAQGYWSMSYVKRQAAAIYNGLPLTANSFDNGGIILDGRYATINLHPKAVKKFSSLAFQPAVSPYFRPDWQPTDPSETLWKMVPSSTYLGKPITSISEIMNRPAQVLADHDPATYINDGFDEVQVYFAINTLMDSLHSFGFEDPDLSTRPFHAFLFDPDISMKDNAYYTDDTINFTTYSGGHQNFARDNSTIWHELGHGVMDRMMGDYLRLADTGGLSEGMADFVAALVVADVSGGMPFTGSDDFRIVNNTGFFLTNEVHDDGEAYGGAMKDMLDSAVRKFGRPGLTKMANLTLEAMRLSRNNPELTAESWFDHMLYADKLGSSVREPEELKEVILSSLAGRNFVFGARDEDRAQFTLKNSGEEVYNNGPASRRSPLPISLSKEERAQYELSVDLKDSASFEFQYPVTVKVVLRGGPIQGAIHWTGEENSPLEFTIQKPGDQALIPLEVSGVCDQVNREDGSCVDFAYVQIWNNGASKPVAKKRFYLKMNPKSAEVVSE